MRDWAGYQLSDLLLFSERVYWRLFVLENTALWPLPVIAPALILAALAVEARRPGAGRRPLFALLALAWLWVGWHFVWQRYAAVNWAMVYVAPLFAVQSAAFARAALHDLAEVAVSRAVRIIGHVLVVVGAVAYPCLALLQGRTIAGAEVAGIAPDPTAAAGLGAALLMPPGWHRRVALVLCMAWLGQSVLTLLVLDRLSASAPALVLVIGFLALALSRR